MAELLEIPSGAMMSRLSRAKNQSNNFFSKESAAMADRRST
jgi:DNA-directed RNA polymerase specialized sigma24 family protein